MLLWVLAAILIVVAIFFLVLRNNSQKSEGVISEQPKPANYNPKAFSTYTSSSLQPEEGGEDLETLNSRYKGVIKFRSDAFEAKNGRTCYDVLKEDQALFPNPVVRACANNDASELFDIHTIGGVGAIPDQRYLITLQNPVVEGDIAEGYVLQVRTRSQEEDIALTDGDF